MGRNTMSVHSNSRATQVSSRLWKGRAWEGWAGMFEMALALTTTPGRKEGMLWTVKIIAGEQEGVEGPGSRGLGRDVWNGVGFDNNSRAKKRASWIVRVRAGEQGGQRAWLGRGIWYGQRKGFYGDCEDHSSSRDGALGGLAGGVERRVIAEGSRRHTITIAVYNNE